MFWVSKPRTSEPTSNPNKIPREYAIVYSACTGSRQVVKQLRIFLVPLNVVPRYQVLDSLLNCLDIRLQTKQTQLTREISALGEKEGASRVRSTNADSRPTRNEVLPWTYGWAAQHIPWSIADIPTLSGFSLYEQLKHQCYISCLYLRPPLFFSSRPLGEAGSENNTKSWAYICKRKSCQSPWKKNKCVLTCTLILLILSVKPELNVK